MHSSTPSISYSRSTSPSPENVSLQKSLSAFNHARLTRLQEARELNTNVSQAELYKQLHPEATQADVLHFESNMQAKKLQDRFDNMDMLLQSVPASTPGQVGNTFQPSLYEFRNLPTNTNERVFTHLTVDELIFQSTGIDKAKKLSNVKASNLQKHLSKITKQKNFSFKTLTPVQHYSLHYILEQYVKLGECVQWLSEEIALLTGGLVEPIRQAYVDAFAQEIPQIRTLDFPAVRERLRGLREFSQNVGYFSTVPEDLLDLFFQKHSKEQELLDEIRHNQRCRPLTRKAQYWKRPRNPTNEGVPTAQIVKEVPKPSFFSFVEKRRQRNQQAQYGNNSSFSSSRYRQRKNTPKSRKKYRRSKSASRVRSNSRSRFQSRSQSQGRHRSNSRRRRSRSFSQARQNSTSNYRKYHSDSSRQKSSSTIKKAATPNNHSVAAPSVTA